MVLGRTADMASNSRVSVGGPCKPFRRRNESKLLADDPRSPRKRVQMPVSSRVSVTDIGEKKTPDPVCL